jgi:CRP/FNR family transcriptional regulator
MSDEQNGPSEERRSYAILEIDEVLPILSEISIFAGLSDAQLHRLFELLRKTSYEAGEKVFAEGEQPGHIYIVQSGSVKLVVNCEDTPLELIEFRKGRCFGETSVIGIQPHAATAVCVTDTELIVLSRNTLLSLYKSDLEMFSTLILNIAREACRRLAKTDEILLHYVVGQ